MSSDTEKHADLLRALRDAQGKGDGAFEQATVRALEHVFDHLERLNSHVSLGGPDGDGRSLKPGESSTLR